LKANAVIVYLCGPSAQDRLDLEESLRRLYIHFNRQFQYDVIVFHENLSGDYIKWLFERPYCKMPIRDVVIRFHIPPGTPDNVINSTPGYRAMCRWFSGPFFHCEELKNYRWCWHFDTDSFLMGPVEYDPFLYLQEHNKIYGYQVIYNEPPHARVGFWEVTKKFIEQKGIQSDFLKLHSDAQGNWNYDYYYSDFAIFDLDFFRANNYMEYFKYIDASGGFWLHRYGDTLMCSLGLFMFAKEKDTHQFRDIAWMHQTYYNDGKSIIRKE